MTAPIRLFEKALMGDNHKFLGWIAGEGPLSGLINVNSTQYVAIEFIWTVVPRGKSNPHDTPPEIVQAVCDLYVVTPERARAMQAGLVRAPGAAMSLLDKAARRES